MPEVVPLVEPGSGEKQVIFRNKSSHRANAGGSGSQSHNTSRTGWDTR